MSSGNLTFILSQVAINLPVLAVLVTGLVLSIINRKYYPKACTYAIIAFSLFILERLVGVLLNTLMPLLMMQGSNIDYNQYSIIIGVANILFTLLTTGAYGLLIVAIFAGRKPALSPEQQNQNYYQQPPQAGPQ